MLIPVLAHGHKLDTYKYNCFEARHLSDAELPAPGINTHEELAPHEGKCKIDFQQIPGTKGSELYFIRYKDFIAGKKYSGHEPLEKPTGAVAIFKNNGTLIFAGNEYGNDSYFDNVGMASNSYGKFLILTENYPGAEIPRKHLLYKLEGWKVIDVDSTILYADNMGIYLPGDAKILKGAHIDLRKMAQDLPVWRRGEPDYATLAVKYKYEGGKLLVDSYIYRPDKRFLGPI